MSIIYSSAKFSYFSSYQNLLNKMCPIDYIYDVIMLIFLCMAVLQENNVKACLPLTYTVEEYNIEDIR